MQQMNVNRKSWHFRYNCYLYGRGSMDQVNNGCEYFWRTMLTCVLSPLIAMVVIGEAIHNVLPAFPQINLPEISDDVKERIGNLFVWFSICGIIYATIWGCVNGFAWQVLKAYAIGIALVGGLIGIIFFGGIIHEWNENRPKKVKPIKIKQPNIAWQMIKAKKNKYCPKLVITN